MKTEVAFALSALFCINLTAVADEIASFGSGTNQFDIEFVTIADPGNAADTTGSPSPAGSVEYVYNIGKYEVSRDMVSRANAAGNLEITLDPMTGVTSGPRPNMPATKTSWNEAARFVNWLNVNQGIQPAYKFSLQPGDVGYDAQANVQIWDSSDVGYDDTNPIRNSLARYFLPSVHEMYKAAYYDPAANEGMGGYWDFPTGSDVAPDAVSGGIAAGSAVYDQPFPQGPADIDDAGGLSPYGVMGLGGNVYELLEPELNDMNNDPSSVISISAGSYVSSSELLNASAQTTHLDDDSLVSSSTDLGFRVASAVIENQTQGGDFDGDGALTASDINVLSAEVLKPAPNPEFDLDGDGSVTAADRQTWVTSVEFADTFFGDADLNGEVDFGDFVALSNSFGQSGGWAEGNFDGLGNVDFSDFVLLSNNFGNARVAAQPVPEPHALALAAIAGGLCMLRRRNRR